MEPEVPLVDGTEDSGNHLMSWIVLSVLAVALVALGVTAGVIQKKKNQE